MKFKLVETLDKERYNYAGPVYNQNDAEIVSKAEEFAYAVSRPQAIVIIVKKLQKKFPDAYALNSAYLTKVSSAVQKPATKTSELKTDKNAINGAEQIAMKF